MSLPGGTLRVLCLFTQVYANGGIQRFNQTLLNACETLDVQCDALALNDTQEGIAKKPRQRLLSVVGFSGDRKRFALAVSGALLRRRYDRVIIGHVNLLTLGVALTGFMGWRRPTILLIAHGIEVWSGLGRMRRFALSRVDRVLCVSRYTRERILQQARDLAPGRLQLFPNALADTWAVAASTPSANPVPRKFILSVTRLERSDRYKGIVPVIESLSMLDDATMHYCIVGQGDDLDFLRQVASRCGVGHRVHFLNHMSDAELIELYRQCTAFVLPSGNEGFGIVFLEAMYFGAPVIAAAEKGALDVVHHGKTGLLVRFGDAVAIKNAIERLQGEPDLCDRLRTAGRKTVTNRGEFTFARFTERCAHALGLTEGAGT
jgi:glycosyltransferase involved in cell wall biosynthesis